MKITNIALDGDEKPKTVTVTMSIAEAAEITIWSGDVTPTKPVTSGIYDALADGVFTRYWEDGLTDYRRETGR